MGSKNWDEYNEIGGNVDYYWGKVDWIQNHVGSMETRVSELQSAITNLSLCLDDFNAEQILLKNLPFQASRWSGENAKKYLESCLDCGELYSEYSSFKKSLEIHISDMEAEKRSLEGSISYWNGMKADFNWLYQYFLWKYEGYWSD